MTLTRSMLPPHSDLAVKRTATYSFTRTRVHTRERAHVDNTHHWYPPVVYEMKHAKFLILDCKSVRLL